ncbi:MAG: tRNA (adenosine(37)-N6)-dimethylallyltransferase MiaA, partial [Sphingomonadales bacterium]
VRFGDRERADGSAHRRVDVGHGRDAVRALPVAEAHAALMREDAPAAARLHPSDATRVARALEVVRSTGRALADWQSARTGGIGATVRLSPLLLLPPRDWLRARCDARFEAMLAAGAAEEVEQLRARDLDPALPAMRAIGVREIGDWLDGAIDRATMVTQAQAATRQYAKRQTTWFTHQPPTEWQRSDTQLDSNSARSLVTKLLQILLTR